MTAGRKKRGALSPAHRENLKELVALLQQDRAEEHLLALAGGKETPEFRRMLAAAKRVKDAALAVLRRDTGSQ